MAFGLVVPSLPAASELDRVGSQLQDRLVEAGSRLTLGEVAAWLIVGAVVGTLVGMAFTRKRAGFGAKTNLLVGLLGAGLGGLLFNALELRLDWGALVIPYDRLVSAAVGALLLLCAVRLIKGGGKENSKAKSASR